MKSHWFFQYILRARLFRAQQTTTNGKRKNDPEHYTQTRQNNSAGDAPSTQEKTTKTPPKSDKKRTKTDSFSSLLPDRLRDRLGDLKKHPRERQKATRERPKRPQGLPRGPPDPPRGGPKWLKMQQGDLGATFLGPRGAQRQHSGIIFEPPGGHFVFFVFS